MSAVDTLRVALFGDPPDPAHQPSRDGSLAAFTELYDQVLAVAAGINSYETVALLPVVTGADNGTMARVYDDPTPANNTFWIVVDGAWEIDADFVALLEAAVQPLVDDAEAAAVAAAASAVDAANVADDLGQMMDDFPITDPIDGMIFYVDEEDNIIAVVGEESATLSEFTNIERMYELRTRLGLLDAAKSSQLIIGIIGDSQHDSGAYSAAQDFAEKLIADYGDAGWGWTGFGVITAPPTFTQYRGNIRHTALTIAYTAGWDQEYVEVSGRFPASVAAPDSVDLCAVQSNTVADKLTITCGTAGAVLSAAYLHFTGTADGQVRYRWDAGAWTTINVQGGVGTVGVTNLSTNLPAGTTWVLEIEVVAGTVRLHGMDFQSADDGVRIHNLACSSSRTADWANRDESEWATGVNALGCHAWIIPSMTNDSGGNLAPAAFAVSVSTMISRLRAINPACDICWVGAPENNYDAAHGGSKAYAMSEYSAAAAALMASNDGAFLDLQLTCGDPDAYNADAQFLATFSGTVMTVTSIIGGNYIEDESYVFANIVDDPDGVRITSFGTGAGGVGTYNLAQNVGVIGSTLCGSGGPRCLFADIIHPSQRRGRAAWSGAYTRAFNMKKG